MHRTAERGSAAIVGLSLLVLILGAAVTGSLFVDFVEHADGTSLSAENMLVILEHAWAEPGEVLSAAFGASLLPGKPTSMGEGLAVRNAIVGRLILLVCFIALAGAVLSLAGLLGIVPGVRGLDLLLLPLAGLLGFAAIVSLAWLAISCFTTSGELFKFFSLTGWSFWAGLVLSGLAAGAAVTLFEELEAAH